MKYTLLVTIALSFAFNQQATAESQSQLGAFEKFCLSGKISDACEKAIERLSAKIITSEGKELDELQGRLKDVASTGCKLHDKLSCMRLQDISLSTLTVEAEFESDYNSID